MRFRKMMSIFGRSATPTSSPRRHNHFVPDGYIPPKGRHKVFTPRSYTSMLKGGGSPTRRQHRASPSREPSPAPRNIYTEQHQSVLPYAEFSRPPSRPDSRQQSYTSVDHKATLKSILKKFDGPRRVHSDHEHFSPLQAANSPSPSPLLSTNPRITNSPKGILKKSTSPSGIAKKIVDSPKSPPVSRPRTPQGHQHPRSPPQGQLHFRSPSQGQQDFGSPSQGPQNARDLQGQLHCDVGGDGEDYRAPASREKKVALQSCGLGASAKRLPSVDGSQSSYGPISVVDKYDTRDSYRWNPHYPPGRVPPAKSARGRPRMRNSNVIFSRVVDDGEAVHRTFCEDENEEDEDLHSGKIFRPCCDPLDWDRDPLLRSVEDRQAYRQCKLEDYLREVCARSEPPERFESYLIRCYAYANGELNSNTSKHILGYVDDHLSPLDVWVLRLCRGTLSRLARTGTAYPARDCELFLRILREECVALDSQQNSLLRRHLNETERQLSNDQERNYKKILILSQCTPMGVMQHLRRRDYR